MRTFSVLRMLALAVALSAPLAQAALAGQQEQQAMIQSASASAGISTGGGPYANDAVMAPAVGD
jgi:hypothetical protein